MLKRLVISLLNLNLSLNLNLILILLFILLSSPSTAPAEEMKAGDFLVLCYHAVPVHAPPGDPMSVPQKRFVEQMEYLKTHGYRPVSLEEIVRAHEGKGELPEKAVLLTFDDGYVSYYEFVTPLLREYGYPSVVAIVGSFMGNPPDDLTEPLMSWKQLREVSRSELVEVVSHTYNLHSEVRYTPQGNVGAAVRVRAYHGDTDTYETEEEYRSRIKADFTAQTKLFKRNLGTTPRGIVWPYGRQTGIGTEIAREAGYRVGFSLEVGFNRTDNLSSIKRHLVYNEPMRDFINHLTVGYTLSPIRAVQVDLDTIYVPDSVEQTDRNLDTLIDRLVAMKVNTVFLQAFADPLGTGTIRSVYFPNSVLPVRADIFSHAVHQMIIRDMKVYAWMPTLGIELPDGERNERLRVREKTPDGIRPSQSWYNRLTPFDREVESLVRTLYEELAAHSQVHGILFQDDAYLTEGEDFHPSAVAAYRERFGAEPMEGNGDEERRRRARHKTETLIDFTDVLMDGVKRYAPEARSARNIYPALITDPESEASFAQNYELFLKAYDMVVVMAYPQMENVSNVSTWLEGLVTTARERRHGIEKSIFKVQTYDWKNEAWLKDEIILEEIRDLLAAGAKNVAYYPDNGPINRPGLGTMTLEMSTEVYPFRP